MVLEAGTYVSNNDITFTTTGTVTTTSPTTTTINTTTSTTTLSNNLVLEESNTVIAGGGPIIEANDPNYTPAYHYVAQTFQASATYTMMQVQIDAGQIYSNGTGNLNIVLETNTGNVAPQNINNLSTSIISPVIASATISSNNINKANPITPDWIRLICPLQLQLPQGIGIPG